MPYLSKDAENSLKSRCGKMIRGLSLLPELKDILFLKDGQWFIKIKTIRGFRSVCIKLVDRYNNEQNTPKLTQFMD